MARGTGSKSLLFCTPKGPGPRTSESKPELEPLDRQIRQALQVILASTPNPAPGRSKRVLYAIDTGTEFDEFSERYWGLGFIDNGSGFSPVAATVERDFDGSKNWRLSKLGTPRASIEIAYQDLRRWGGNPPALAQLKWDCLNVLKDSDYHSYLYPS